VRRPWPRGEGDTIAGVDGPLQRLWRIGATGSAFALFGIAALALAAFAFPLLRVLPGAPHERKRRAQRLIHRSFRAFLAYMQLVGLSEIRVRGLERLREAEPQLVVANHPSLLDVVILVSLMPQLDCVVKREAWSNPFMRGVVAAAGYIPNDSGEALVDRCVECIEQRNSLLIFPEGTRSPEGGLGCFQRGAAHTALRSGRPLLPVVIRCDPPTLMRGQKWYDVPPRRMQFSLEVGEPIAPPKLDEGEPRGVAARRMTAALRDFYAKRLQYPT
jgi:1-acyl-sn-glycerol-3-phosphate acyltransferase